MYSAISKANLRPQNWLVIIGAGGGLGHLYVYFTYMEISTNVNKRRTNCETERLQNYSHRRVNATTSALSFADLY